MGKVLKSIDSESPADVVKRTLGKDEYSHLQPGLVLKTAKNFLILGEKLAEYDCDSGRKVVMIPENYAFFGGARSTEMYDKYILGEIRSGHCCNAGEGEFELLREKDIPELKAANIGSDDLYTLPTSEFRQKFRLS